MHATVWQIEGKVCWQLNEIICKEPKNTTKGVCDEFKRMYMNHKGGLFIYGDPSGRNRDTRQEKGFNDYKIIEQELSKFYPSLRVAFAHPAVKMRGNFINTIFESHFMDIYIWINPKCPKTINDLMYTKEDSDGTKLKEKERNPITKVSFERYGHCFVRDTLVQTIKGQKKIKNIKVGDLVLTRKGYKKVLNRFNNGIKEVKTYRIGNKFITCTPDHRFFVNNDFYQVGHLIDWNTFTIFERKKICKKRLLITEAENAVQKNVPGFQEVYDLEVEDCHEYFANGFLVHNCSDGIDYLICEAFKREYEKYQGYNFFGSGMVKMISRKPKFTL
jgi:hypothetical protein